MKAVVAQLVFAGCALIGGAWLIGLWCVGLMVIVIGVVAGADALLRDAGDVPRKNLSSHQEVIERYRRAA